MAKITVTTSGGRQNDSLNTDTVGDLKKTLGLENYVATVNGDVEEGDYAFDDGDSVYLSEAVKGGK